MQLRPMHSYRKVVMIIAQVYVCDVTVNFLPVNLFLPQTRTLHKRSHLQKLGASVSEMEITLM
jgi:hypothetical protein